MVHKRPNYVNIIIIYLRVPKLFINLTDTALMQCDKNFADIEFEVDWSNAAQ